MADSIFGRCSTCIKNMIRGICDFTCAPDQSRFMEVKNQSLNEETQKNYITEVNVIKNKSITKIVQFYSRIIYSICCNFFSGVDS